MLKKIKMLFVSSVLMWIIINLSSQFLMLIKVTCFSLALFWLLLLLKLSRQKFKSATDLQIFLVFFGAFYLSYNLLVKNLKE